MGSPSDPMRLCRVDGHYFPRCRVESVSVEGRTAGTFSNFQHGVWVSAEVSGADIAEGRINVQIDDARQGSNVVVSQASF